MYHNEEARRVVKRLGVVTQSVCRRVGIGDEDFCRKQDQIGDSSPPLGAIALPSTT